MFVLKGFQRDFSDRAGVAASTLRHKLSISCLLAALLALLGWVQPVFAQTSAQPRSCRVGIYLMSLYDLNIGDDSFQADFWIWSNCEANIPEALGKLELINAKKAEFTAVSAEQIRGIYWHQRKIQGRFKYDWDVSNYPFDRHILTIEMENGLFDATLFVYRTDTNISDYDRSIQIDGWRITKFRLIEKKHEYVTTFGDPRLAPGEGSKFSRLVLSIGLERASFIGFLKLNTAVYIAFVISLLCYFLPSSLIDGRINTLVGCLFAVLVNQQVADTSLGSTEGISLVNQIHFTAMLYILVAVVVSIISFMDGEKSKENAARRRDRDFFFIAGISYIVANITIVVMGAIAG